MEDRIIVEEHDNVKIFAILDGHGGTSFFFIFLLLISPNLFIFNLFLF